jgi:hypothetical protein
MAKADRVIGGATGVLAVASGGWKGLLWLAFARHEKMAHTLRGGGSLDCCRAAGDGG